MSDSEMLDAYQRSIRAVRWLEPESSPFGIRVLDCRSIAASGYSAFDEKVTAAFSGDPMNSSWDDRCGKPDDPFSFDCALAYPHVGAHKDGTLFLAPDMDHKWNIHLYNESLFCVRSWTDQLIFSCDIAFGSSIARIGRITATRKVIHDDPIYATAIVDFLIKSHLHRTVAPHPLPPGREDEDSFHLAVFSRTTYGALGLYGTFEDTVQFRLERSGDGGYRINTDV